MSIKLGGSKSKTTESKSSTSNSTTMPIVPEWGASLTQSAAGRIGELLGQEPQSFVAPANGLQELAGAGAGRLGQGASLYGEAGDLVRGVGQRGAAANVYEAQQAGPASKAMAGSLLDNLDSYMSPYRRDVVDAALADFDFGAGQTRAQLDLDLAGSGAFGGSGSALTRSAISPAVTISLIPVSRVRPKIAPRAFGSQYGAPRPVNAGTRYTPQASPVCSAIASVSRAWLISLMPSRSHCTAAPATKMLPSTA